MITVGHSQAYNKLSTQCASKKEKRVQSKCSSSSFSGFTSPLAVPIDYLPSGDYSSQSGPCGYKPQEFSKYRDVSPTPTILTCSALLNGLVTKLLSSLSSVVCGCQ